MICPKLFPANTEEHARLAAQTDLTRYRDLHPDGRQLIRNWFRRAVRRWEGGIDPIESFEPFIYAWIAFNGWSSCVTELDKDWKIIDSLSLNARLSDDFDDLLRSSNTSFRTDANDFYQLWPIFNAQDLRRRRIRVGDGILRDERIDRYLSAGANQYSPPCWKWHLDNNI